MPTSRPTSQNTTGQDSVTHDRQIREMFAGIAGVYDRMNGLLSLGLDARWRRNLAAAIDPAAADLLDWPDRAVEFERALRELTA